MHQGRGRSPGSFHARSRQPRRAPRSRVGLVLGAKMDFGGLHGAEMAFADEGIRLAPINCSGGQFTVTGGGAPVTVLPTADVGNIKDGSLAGLIVPGGDLPDNEEGSGGFEKLIEATRKGHLPVMAFGDGVPLTLQACGFDTDRAMPAAVLVHDGVRILETLADVKDAIPAFFPNTGSAKPTSH